MQSLHTPPDLTTLLRPSNSQEIADMFLSLRTNRERVFTSVVKIMKAHQSSVDGQTLRRDAQAELKAALDDMFHLQQVLQIKLDTLVERCRFIEFLSQNENVKAIDTITIDAFNRAVGEAIHVMGDGLKQRSELLDEFGTLATFDDEMQS
eukprot:TRINITY_DN19040_c0_g1_i1.p1 TRINITY_DN19040_c0_g1~~TRINITY_DN19040_c0_g1_i1.p1  ORF type:complete len:150 (+),score=46.34 TRINITY_DN19040_c0_g1_i1:43-492(+)